VYPSHSWLNSSRGSPITPISYPDPHGLLTTRDAHEALAILQKLVDSAEEKIRLAERETVAVAIGLREGDNPLRTLRAIAETLKSPDFETAVSVAREKMQVAVDWDLNLNNSGVGSCAGVTCKVCLSNVL